jgi:uncharacterized cupredoxin-like copper-binding protein
MKRSFVAGPILVALLFLLAACGSTGGNTTGSVTAPQAALSTANTVNITETDFKIQSSITTFTPGTSYHFEITNHGNTAHEFMILPKAEGSMGGMSMDNMDKMALAKAENIGPGQTTAFNYTFPSSAAGSHPEFACYYPGHYQAGMKQDVVVKS